MTSALNEPTMRDEIKARLDEARHLKRQLDDRNPLDIRNGPLIDQLHSIAMPNYVSDVQYLYDALDLFTRRVADLAGELEECQGMLESCEHRLAIERGEKPEP